METWETPTRSQLRAGNRPWGGRLWETGGPTDRNRIEGRRGEASWHNTAKPIGSSTEVPPEADPHWAENAAVVPGSNTLLSGEIPGRECPGKSADAIVCAGQRTDREGSSPSGSRMEGTISKDGGNASPGPTGVGQGRASTARWSPKGLRKISA